MSGILTYVSLVALNLVMVISQDFRSAAESVPPTTGQAIAQRSPNGVNLFFRLPLERSEWLSVLTLLGVEEAETLREAWNAYEQKARQHETQIEGLRARAATADRNRDQAQKCSVLGAIFKDRNIIASRMSAALADLFMTLSAACDDSDRPVLAAYEREQARDASYDLLSGMAIPSEARIDPIAILGKVDMDQATRDKLRASSDAHVLETNEVAGRVANKYADAVGADYDLMAEMPLISSEPDEEKRNQLSLDWTKRRQVLWGRVLDDAASLARRNRAFVEAVELAQPEAGRKFRESFEEAAFPQVFEDRKNIRKILSKVVEVCVDDSALLAAVSPMRDTFEQEIAASYAKQLKEQREWEESRFSKAPIAAGAIEAHEQTVTAFKQQRIAMAKKHWDRALEVIGGNKAEQLRQWMQPRTVER